MKDIHLTIKGADEYEIKATLCPSVGMAWLSGLGGSFEILFDAEKRECYRIAVATTPPQLVSSGSRPGWVNNVIDNVLHLKRVGSAAQ